MRRRRAAVPRRTTVKRQAFGNFASAMQQRDATNIVINTQEEYTLTVPAQCKEATGVRNMNAMLTTSPMFYNYATMYDQFKLNAVRISCEMTYINNQLLNSANFPSIATAWDRNGIRPRVVQSGPADNRQPAFLLPEYSTVASYSSAAERTLYYGAKWSVVRQLDASSMMEKSIYVGTVNTKDILTTDNLYGAWNPQFLIGIKSPTTLKTKVFNCVVSIDNLVKRAPGAFSSSSKKPICKCKYLSTIIFLILEVITLPIVSNFHILRKIESPFTTATTKNINAQSKPSSLTVFISVLDKALIAFDIT